MYLIDTHTHLYLDEFKDDRDKVISRAMEQGVKKFFLPNIDSSSIDAMLNLTNLYPQNCYPMMGLHPTSVNANYKSELEVVKDQLKHLRYFAIGEVGIDLYWDMTFKHEQIKAFKEQVECSLEYKLPLVIHSRNSIDLIISILKEFESSEIRGVFHSFTGNIKQAEEAIALGFILGIGGIVTFKNSMLDKVVEQIDISHIVLETDSPYLAPVPKRGKRNESSYLVHIADKIAQIHQMDITQVAKMTTRNALYLFGMNDTTGGTNQ
jgi:TatD DNase family protein